ncbi:helicase-associated domain-containing protein [Barrientosiimonas endolithica]|uniref:Helicase XPB/Ssl2 N-terminal domain-containing protein n=1 Tax=Barrientosiimonas endolithica TaxID=1535208 RepID=A0ABM8H7F4_9MICO|nr:helicase-associated domain-containing protein [Barrientosiimonas endolithica]BDZ56764.1 hypothetical protein GCM10025872_04210 [Barrientosiimonas endolithica]
MPSPARSFADDVRARDDAELARLVRLRPDLARPAPANLSALAARAATVPSTRRALEQLDAGLLHVLESVLVAGASGPAAAALLGADEATLAAPLDELWGRGLVWRSPEGMRPARAVGETLTHPAGLGPVAAELGVRPPADVGAAVSGLSDAARRVLDRLRWGVPRASFEGAALTAARDELVTAGLMARLDGADAVVPREVGIALRGGVLHENPLLPPDSADLTTLTTADIDASAGAEALELLDQVEEVARAWEGDPPRVLRSGGLSVKDHKAVATRLDSGLDRAAFVVEIAAAAGLLASDGELDPSWLPTPAYDDWRAREPGRRWADLALAWWGTVRAPSLVGERLEGRSVVNVLSEQAAWPLLRTRRHDVVAVLAALPAGAAPRLADVEERLRWIRPLRLPSGAPTQVATVLQEAAWLGVTGRGALSAVGRGLHDGLDAAALSQVAAAHLPEPVDHVLVQADLTAIAPGPLTDDLGRLMRLAADVESRGGATVFRFTPGSVRRALDSGLASADLLGQLGAASRTPLPQPLTYLVADVARRHGQARVGSVGCYVRSEDETALSAMLADRDLAPLQLRRIAPTVLVSPLRPRPRWSCCARTRPWRRPPTVGSCSPAAPRGGRPAAGPPPPARSRSTRSTTRSLPTSSPGCGSTRPRRPSAARPSRGRRSRTPTPRSPSRCWPTPLPTTRPCGWDTSTRPGTYVGRCSAPSASTAGGSSAASRARPAAAPSRSTGSPASRRSSSGATHR